MTATQTARPTQNAETLLREMAFVLKMAQLVKGQVLVDVRLRDAAIRRSAARRAAGLQPVAAG